MTKSCGSIKKNLIGTSGFMVGGMEFSSISYASIMGANERINVVVVCIRIRGDAHIKSF